VHSLNEIKGYSFSKNKEEYIKEGKGITADCGLEGWLNRRIVCTTNPEADALDKLSWLTGTSFKDYDVNVVLSLCADEYRREIIENLDKLLNKDSATNYIYLLTNFISAYEKFIVSNPQALRGEDYTEVGEAVFYRIGIYDDFELAILESKSGTVINEEIILSELGKCWGGSYDELEKKRKAFIKEYLGDNSKSEDVSKATKGWYALAKLIDGCKKINKLNSADKSKAFIIPIVKKEKNSEGKNKKEEKTKYALFGIPLTVCDKKKKQVKETEQDNGISISFKLLSCAIAVMPVKPIESGEACLEAAISDENKG
ncbi:MAG: hypothetical protein ACI4MC_02750, partial [Candidatus Coproplasma sp.]